MSLTNIYNNQVKGKQSVSNLSFGSKFPFIERDPKFKKLETDVFSKLIDISEKDNKERNVVINTNNNINLQNYSFEDAIRELSNFYKKAPQLLILIIFNLVFVKSFYQKFFLFS
jgi:hypothetical protein